MKKIKEIIGKTIITNKKTIIAVIITMVLTITIGVKAATMYASRDVIYDNSSSGTTASTVQEALDELYEKGNSGGSTSSICTSNSGSISYALGTSYTCNPGDKYRIFYVLEDNGDSVDLIMDQNIGDEVAWNSSGSNKKGPVTANNYLKKQTSSWTVDVSLPTYDQIYNVNNSKKLTSTPWLYDNLWKSSNTSLPGGYWTSTPCSSSRGAWFVRSTGNLIDSNDLSTGGGVDNTFAGVRPVITVSKSQLSQ